MFEVKRKRERERKTMMLLMLLMLMMISDVLVVVCGGVFAFEVIPLPTSEIG